MKLKIITPLVLALIMPAAGYAVEAHHQPAAAGAANSVPMSDGEVRKVDKETQKVTIKHGPIENLGMPAMTMVFRVSNPAMLGQLNTGDKVRFSADKVGGVYTVTKVEIAK